MVLVELETLFDPHTVSELTRATELRLMCLLHLSGSSHHALLLICLVEVAQELEDSVSD